MTEVLSAMREREKGLQKVADDAEKMAKTARAKRDYFRDLFQDEAFRCQAIADKAKKELHKLRRKIEREDGRQSHPNNVELRDRNNEIFHARLRGDTYTKIAKDFNISADRVRRIIFKRKSAIRIQVIRNELGRINNHRTYNETDSWVCENMWLEFEPNETGGTLVSVRSAETPSKPFEEI